FGANLDADAILWAIRNSHVEGAEQVLERAYTSPQRDRAIAVFALEASANKLLNDVSPGSRLANEIENAIDGLHRHVADGSPIERSAITAQIERWRGSIANESWHPDGPRPDGREARQHWIGERSARVAWLTELASLLSLWIKGVEPTTTYTDLELQVDELL